MRVLVITTWIPTTDQPAKAIFVKRHIDALAGDHDVHVAALVPAGKEVIDFGNVPVTTIPFEMRRPAVLAATFRPLRRLIRQERPDVIHTMGFSALPFGALGGRRPWVHTDHWTGLVEPASVGTRWQRVAALRHLLRLPDVVTAVSTYMADAIRPFARAEKVLVAPNVVTSEGDLRPPPPPSPVRLVTVGALIERKRPLLAIDTLTELRSRGLDARVTFVGDGPLRAQVVSYAQEEGLAQYVDLVGTVAPDGVSDFLDQAHVLLHTSDVETFSVVAAEAVMRGRPVVIGDTGGPRDFITNGNGFPVAGDDPRLYADAVENALNLQRETSPAEIAASLGQRFSPDAVAQDFMRAYRLAGAC